MLHPISFSIPEYKIVSDVPVKTKLLAHVIPGDASTYIFTNESDYYKDYQTSLFGFTTKKNGWDCMRHYEIIANGCIPYFIDIESCPIHTMTFLPKSLIIEGNVLFEKISSYFNKNNNMIESADVDACYKIIKQLLHHLRTQLTTRTLASYILNSSNHSTATSILYLSGDISPDYLRCSNLHGFKELLHAKCHDYPLIPHIYKLEKFDYSQLYGKGFSYSNHLDISFHDFAADYTIINNIVNKKYDIVIYGSYHRGMPLYDLVSTYYKPNEIIMVCGEDISSFYPNGHCVVHNCDCRNWVNKGHHVFMRELSNL